MGNTDKGKTTVGNLVPKPAPDTQSSGSQIESGQAIVTKSRVAILSPGASLSGTKTSPEKSLAPQVITSPASAAPTENEITSSDPSVNDSLNLLIKDPTMYSQATQNEDVDMLELTPLPLATIGGQVENENPQSSITPVTTDSPGDDDSGLGECDLAEETLQPNGPQRSSTIALAVAPGSSDDEEVSSDGLPPPSAQRAKPRRTVVSFDQGALPTHVLALAASELSSTPQGSPASRSQAMSIGLRGSRPRSHRRKTLEQFTPDDFDVPDGNLVSMTPSSTFALKTPEDGCDSSSSSDDDDDDEEPDEEDGDDCALGLPKSKLAGVDTSDILRKSKKRKSLVDIWKKEKAKLSNVGRRGAQ